MTISFTAFTKLFASSVCSLVGLILDKIVSFGSSDTLALAALSAIWAIALPAMFWIAENGIRRTDELA